MFIYNEHFKTTNIYGRSSVHVVLYGGTACPASQYKGTLNSKPPSKYNGATISQVSFLAFALENKEAEKVFNKKTEVNKKRGRYHMQNNFVYQCEQQCNETFLPCIGIV